MTRSTPCEALNGVMVEVLYEEATPAERDRLERHLAGCDACNEEMNALRRVRARLRAVRSEPAPTPRVLVLGRHRTPGWVRAGGLAAAAALMVLGALAIFRTEVDVVPGGLVISFGDATERIATGRDEIGAEIAAALESYRQQDVGERDLMVASFREELRRRDALRKADADSLANLLMESWNRTREDDLRFVIDRLGSLEQQTGRTQELLQYAVYEPPSEH